MEIPVTELADMAMEQESIEMKTIEMGYVTWLVEELKEMRIDEEVLECIRKMACQGDCDGLCEEGVNDECALPGDVWRKLWTRPGFDRC